MLDRDAFEELRDVGEEWIGNIRDDETIHMTPTGAQGSRMRIGIVAEGLDSAAYLTLNFGANRHSSIYDSGHGGCRDTCFFCYLSNIHVWLGSVTFLYPLL